MCPYRGYGGQAGLTCKETGRVLAQLQIKRDGLVVPVFGSGARSSHLLRRLQVEARRAKHRSLSRIVLMSKVDDKDLLVMAAPRMQGLSESAPQPDRGLVPLSTCLPFPSILSLDLRRSSCDLEHRWTLMKQ